MLSMIIFGQKYCRRRKCKSSLTKDNNTVSQGQFQNPKIFPIKKHCGTFPNPTYWIIQDIVFFFNDIVFLLTEYFFEFLDQALSIIKI